MTHDALGSPLPPTKLTREERGRDLTDKEIVEYLADHQTLIRHGMAPVALEVAAQLHEEVEALRAMFDLRWQADLRAIGLWQEAHLGRELVWPDHADLVVWLLEQLPEPPQRTPCPVCPHWLELHNPDGSCGCGMNCSKISGLAGGPALEATQRP